jgi:GNAT superfamily N-acetyltransferase
MATSLHVAFRLRALGHPDALRLLGGYRDELEARISGFEPARAAPVHDDEFVAPRGCFVVGYLEPGGPEALSLLDVAPEADVLDEAAHGPPVACGGLRLIPWRDGPPVAELKRMYVVPGARGHGVARRLLVALQGAAATLGCSQVVLDTAAELTEALGLYRRAGYQSIPRYNDNPHAAHWFSKTL